MLLTMDTPSRTTGTYVSGGNMVAPTASSIMSNILPYLGIAPEYTEEEIGYADATVPYVVGMTEEEAAAKLASYGFENYRTVGDGATVTDQTPLGGAIVPANAEIILYMGAEKSTELCTVPNVIGMVRLQCQQGPYQRGTYHQDHRRLHQRRQSHHPVSGGGSPGGCRNGGHGPDGPGRNHSGLILQQDLQGFPTRNGVYNRNTATILDLLPCRLITAGE